jgi:hypothetical protein
MSITAAQAKANVAKGKAAERDAARFLTAALGYPDEGRIVRAVRTGSGAVADPGDLARLQGLIVSVKDADRIKYLREWMGELDAMDGPDIAVRFLVHKWRYHPIHQWHVYTRAGVLASLVQAAGFGDPGVVGPWARRVRHDTQPPYLRTPVRMELGHWSAMLADAGFRYTQDDQQVGDEA